MNIKRSQTTPAAIIGLEMTQTFYFSVLSSTFNLTHYNHTLCNHTVRSLSSDVLQKKNNYVQDHHIFF